VTALAAHYTPEHHMFRDTWAMIGIASAQDVDTAMTLGLNYPRGPLALTDWLGGKECHEILAQMQAITGDDRYRPSQWLRRRAMLGMSATTPE
jgi:3-hydroxybutyryl-CoA dehydrogenase